MTVPGEGSAIRVERSRPLARLPAGAIGWALFEGGRNPYIVLVVIYIFMPYVASVMLGDPVAGQSVIARWNQYFGWIVMLTAPLLGAAVDKIGRRKPLLAGLVALMVPMIFALWWAKPDGTGLSVSTTMALALSVLVLFAYTEVIHNSLLVGAAGPTWVHTASGLALLLGNLFALLALAFCAWAFVLPGKVSWPWVPHAPLFGLDAATHQPERIVAPISAVLLGLGLLPLLVLTPDAPRSAIPIRSVPRQAVGEIGAMLRAVARYRQAMIFLGARMFFVDGMAAFLVYSGIYAIGVMRWSSLEMFAYGLVLSLCGTMGGLLGARLDATVGAARALRIEIAGVFAGIVVLLGFSPDRIGYVWAYDPALHRSLWVAPIFATLPDLLFVVTGAVIFILVCAHFASSRTLLTRLTPPAQTGTFFGVYALSGVATGWLAPTLVSIGTGLSHSQKGGFAAILVLLAAGLIGLGFLRDAGGLRDGPQTLA